MAMKRSNLPFVSPMPRTVTRRTSMPRRRSTRSVNYVEESDEEKVTTRITRTRQPKAPVKVPVKAPVKALSQKRQEQPPLQTRSRVQIKKTQVAVDEQSESEDSEVSYSEEESDASEEESDASEASMSVPKRTVRATLPTKRSAIAIKTQRKTAITPRKLQRVNAIIPVTPFLSRTQERSIPSTAYELARERLHVSAVPDTLPCREDEFDEITGYLECAIEEGTGTCLYISGVPGTGKTATVLDVIRHLQHKSDTEQLPAFDFVEINGMKLTDPNQAYTVLWECLEKSAYPEITQKRRITSAHALQLLEAKFNQQSTHQKTTVVLMDELDILVTKKQTVMYNFFEWPNRPFSKLIVVAVANTMDLPERMLSNKVSSRLGLTRLNFQSYNHEQLFKIVESRLQGIEAFEKEAVEFAARKVSSVSGDARRALDICRRAVEIVELRLSKQSESTSQPPKHVTIGIVNEAIREMFASPSVAFVQSCSLHQQLFLVSVMRMARRTGLADVEFGDTALEHMETCKWYSIDRPTMSDLMRVCESLSQTRALVVEGGRLDLGMRISLNLAEEDIIMACKSDKIVGRLLATFS
ncbi:P-loop containing nucleoside triphosphate hydrolase protein [Spinellus fusiger]|nr:P-loop containing nucleoside triphosphate hydrolase protein [Spinellus fusiger]